ncbi:MAG: hypothetical protein WA154_02105 [Moraxellaceae bacterium]
MTMLWRVAFLLLLVLLSWCGWLLYQQQQLALAQLQQDQKTLSQQLGDLNDRLVAVARLQAQSVSLSAQQSVAAPAQAELLRQNIRHGLLLAQAALQDGRQEDADALLLNIQTLLQQPTQQALAPALLEGLLVAVQADRMQLGQTAQLRQTARHSIDRALMRIQQQLDQMARQGPVLHTPSVTDTDNTTERETVAAPDWWARVTQIVSIQQVSSEQQVTLTQRALLCREVALTVGLARHAVRQQQPDQLQALLREAVQQLSRLPDAEATQTRQWLEQLLASPLPTAQPLKSLSLLPEREPS